MGVVYEARHKALRQSVAVKVLSSQLGNDVASRSRFSVEAQTTAMLHHINIVPVFGVGEHLDHCSCVMQYIPSRGLDEVIAANVRRSTPPSSPHTHLIPEEGGIYPSHTPSNRRWIQPIRCRRTKCLRWNMSVAWRKSAF